MSVPMRGNESGFGHGISKFRLAEGDELQQQVERPAQDDQEGESAIAGSVARWWLSQSLLIPRRRWAAVGCHRGRTRRAAGVRLDGGGRRGRRLVRAVLVLGLPLGRRRVRPELLRHGLDACSIVSSQISTVLPYRINIHNNASELRVG